MKEIMKNKIIGLLIWLAVFFFSIVIEMTGLITQEMAFFLIITLVTFIIYVCMLKFKFFGILKFSDFFFDIVLEIAIELVIAYIVSKIIGSQMLETYQIIVLGKLMVEK